ncbi:hypothetical protein HZH66_002158 [Vespula vulgaris]|uniref:Uncharacterized protein n=1 Tax=Vespula vulgaris TaxID=7454 RepID=A0A834KKM0_VESVU|nr:hypothetical protein HZH66_002158 [Vespula vulgaris]
MEERGDMGNTIKPWGGRGRRENSRICAGVGHLCGRDGHTGGIQLYDDKAELWYRCTRQVFEHSESGTCIETVRW